MVDWLGGNTRFEYSIDQDTAELMVCTCDDMALVSFSELEYIYLEAKEVNDRLKGERDANTT